MALNKAQQCGEISGFYGRLGDLGRINKEYDTSITSVCP